MDRSSFDFWGMNLTPGDFSCALAALGVLGSGWWRERKPKDNLTLVKQALERQIERAEAIIPWRIPLTPGQWTERQRPPLPEILAEAWKDAVRYKNVRFELSDSEKNPLWLVQQLSRSEVNAASVYVRLDTPTTDINWSWPLEVGFLTDAASQALRNELEATGQVYDWLKRLVKFVNLEGGADACSLLLLPMELRAAMMASLQASAPLRADCIVLLARMADSEQRSYEMLKAMRSCARTAGVAHAYIPSEARAQWFTSLVRHLSHNHKLDESLFAASQALGTQSRAPLLVAARRLVEHSYLGQRLVQLADLFSRPVVAQRMIKVSGRTAHSLIVSEGMHTLGYLASHIRQESSRFLVESEGAAASAALEIEELAKQVESSDVEKMSGGFIQPGWVIRGNVNQTRGLIPKVPKAVPREAAIKPEQGQPRLRWIQAEVYDCAGTQETQIRDALRPTTPYAVDVFIGPRNKNTISANVPFSEELLPPSTDGHELTVIFIEPLTSPEPQVATIFLPRQGESNKCRFRLLVKSDLQATRLEARLIVLHKNRVIQTALMGFPLKQDESAAPAEKITLIIESVVRAQLGELGSNYRQQFDSALLLNHGADNVPRVYKIAGKSAHPVALQGIEKTIDFFDRKISEIVKKPEAFDKLDSKSSADLLFGLASQGSLLYKQIVTAQPVDDLIAAGRRVQVISANTGAQLPIELMYDRAAPLPEAKVCKGAVEALEQGECPHTCPTGERQNTVICPLGFWGLSRIIERHVHDPKKLEQMKGTSFVLQPEPMEASRRIDISACALFAASQRVDADVPGGIARVGKALKKIANKNSQYVKSWKDWVTDVTKLSPSLLVLMPHTFEDRRSEEQGLEISKRDQLLPANLAREHVQGQKNLSPVVILMGCSTAVPKFDYQNFAFLFRISGAAIVISTGATILGEHAAPITEAFLAAIATRPKDDPRSLGEIMRDVRRKLVAKGFLIVLSLSCYGDTDWLLS